MIEKDKLSLYQILHVYKDFIKSKKGDVHPNTLSRYRELKRNLPNTWAHKHGLLNLNGSNNKQKSPD